MIGDLTALEDGTCIVDAYQVDAGATDDRIEGFAIG